MVLALAGRGGVAKDATYEGASKLREAVIASGVECPGDAVKHDDKNGEDCIKCSGSLALSVFDTDQNHGLAKAVYGFSKSTYLAGPKWIIQGDDEGVLAKLKDKLGGSLTVS
jgi:hypothetical protein